MSKQLNNAERTAVYQRPLGLSKNGKLPHGSITETAERYGVSRDTISRIWKRGKDSSKDQRSSACFNTFRPNSGRNLWTLKNYAIKLKVYISAIELLWTQVPTGLHFLFICIVYSIFKIFLWLDAAWRAEFSDIIFIKSAWTAPELCKFLFIILAYLGGLLSTRWWPFLKKKKKSLIFIASSALHFAAVLCTLWWNVYDTVLSDGLFYRTLHTVPQKDSVICLP